MNRTQRAIVELMQSKGAAVCIADFAKLQIGDSGLKKSLSALVAEGIIEQVEPVRWLVAAVRYRLDPGQTEEFVGLHRWKLTKLGESV